jgi:hypothetical protein
MPEFIWLATGPGATQFTCMGSAGFGNLITPAHFVSPRSFITVMCLWPSATAACLVNQWIAALLAE